MLPDVDAVAAVTAANAADKNRLKHGGGSFNTEEPYFYVYNNKGDNNPVPLSPKPLLVIRKML